MRSVPRAVAARAAASALAVLTLTSCASGAGPSAGPSATPSQAPTPVTLTVASGNTTLKVRHVAATKGNELARIPSGSAIVADCLVNGEAVSGTQGQTEVWLHVMFQGKSGFVSAAYVAGGAAARLDACAATPAIATTPRPAPTASTGAEIGATIVAIAQSQVGVAEKGTNCNAYSTRCEEWCGFFAAWVWRQAGIEVPPYGFTGDFYTWGMKNGRAHDGLTDVAPGDLVLYGTGPKTVRTSTHVDIVVAVHPDHLRVIGGNVSDRVTERDVPRSGSYAHVSARG